MKKLPLFESIATLVGTIIGAGILGLPYVFAKAGFWTGALVLVVIGTAMMLMKLLFGEATLRTRGKHQLCGYSEIYLGKFFKHLTAASLIFGIYGALLAYTIGEGEVISSITGASPFYSSLAFFIIFSLLIYWGLLVIKRTELIMTGFIFIIVIVITVLSFDHINLSNIQGFNPKLLFLPYGVILFACSGLVAIPEVRQILTRREKIMHRAIIWGCLIPPIIYFLFAALVISVSGTSVTEVATVGLGEILGWKMILVANIFAFFAMATSFLTLGLALKQMYQFDYKLPRFWAWILTIVVPLIIFFIGARNFVSVISIVGAIGVGITGIINVFIYFSARRQGQRQPEYTVPKYLGTIGGGTIIILFALGIVYTIANLI